MKLTRGDIDATIAQVGFNVAQMIIPVFLLAPAGIPFEFSVTHLLPGYALGFLIGSLGLCAAAIRLARRENRDDVTAHVYGNNVPAIIAYTLAIMLPVYLEIHDAEQAWRIGAAAVIWTGLIKLAACPFANVIRKLIPQPAAMTVFGAAMYSYLALVLLQRVFDQPIVGLIALAIVITAVLAGVPITRHRIPPFLVAWLIPLAVGIALGYVHPAWPGLRPTLPLVASLGPLSALPQAIPYLSVIAPMAIYHVLQDIASVAGASAAGDDYDVREILFWDGLGTLICGAAGSTVAPVVYALHPPYKQMGARIAFSFWTPLLFALIVISGLSLFIAQLFPWSILAAMIAYIAIGVGMATLRRVDPKYYKRRPPRIRPHHGSSRRRRRQLRAPRPRTLRREPASPVRVEPHDLLDLRARPRQRIPISSSRHRLRAHRINQPQFRTRRRVVLHRGAVFMVRINAFRHHALGRAAAIRHRLDLRRRHRLLRPLVARG